jgi:hypothetical protein
MNKPDNNSAGFSAGKIYFLGHKHDFSLIFLTQNDFINIPG